MNNHIAFYGFTTEEMSLLMTYMPDGYFFKNVTEVTELIVAHSICSIICSEGMNAKSRELLDNFYLDVGENTDEQVIWIDSQTKPPVLEGVYYHYDNLLDLLPELGKVLARAQMHYEIQQMYCGAYAFLDKRGIEDFLEEELRCCWYRKYGKIQNAKRLLHEWIAVLEVSAIPELAAVYEFTSWLKEHKHPYLFGGTAVAGYIPYLLEIHEVNPLPPHLYCPKCKKVVWRNAYKDGFDIPPEICPKCGELMQGDGHNLIWQEYASYGRMPTYVFYLPSDMQPLIRDWLEHHWLQRITPDEWRVEQPCEHHLVWGNMNFRFELDRQEISAQFHRNCVDAKAFPEGLTQQISRLGIEKTIYKDETVAHHLLRENKIKTEDIPPCREEVFFYLKEHGFIEKDAFRGMCSVRKGKGLPVVTEDMRTAEDHWKAEYFNQIDWMPSKAMLLQKRFFELKG